LLPDVDPKQNFACPIERWTQRKFIANDYHARCVTFQILEHNCLFGIAALLDLCQICLLSTSADLSSPPTVLFDLWVLMPFETPSSCFTFGTNMSSFLGTNTLLRPVPYRAFLLRQRVMTSPSLPCSPGSDQDCIQRHGRI
jgi:hypothetical protein